MSGAIKKHKQFIKVKTKGKVLRHVKGETVSKFDDLLLELSRSH